MKSLPKLLVAALTGAILSLAATAALADNHGYRGHYDDHRWEHRHYRYSPPPVYYRGGPAVYAPYYAPAPIIIERAPPPVYIEQADVVEESPEATNYWHYCRESKAYYPYVKECPAGWQKVLPQPPK